MPRPKKDIVKFSSSMDRTLFEKIQAYSAESGLPLTVIFAKALKLYFESIEKKNDEKK